MSSTTVTSVEHIEATPGVIGGKPRIKGTRFGVHHVKIWHLDQGRSVEDIAADYELTPSQIHAALAYYYDHQQVIDRLMAEADTFAEGLRRRTPSKMQDKLRELDRA